MRNRTRFEAGLDKRQAVEDAEEAGTLADSMSVRLALIKRVNNGEISLVAAKVELARIQRNAKKAGKLTRAQAFSRG
jgi:hypothetical protein